jgi:hypothetical protein
LGVRVDFVASRNVVELLALATSWSIVGLPIVVLLKICFDPLTELQVILVFGFNEFSNIDVALDAILVKCCLQYLIVLYKFMFVLCLPLYSAVGEAARIQRVHYAAINGCCRALLNFGDP